MSEKSSGFGDKIEDYDLSTLLGKGGFARVYKAKCKNTGKWVAIKMIERKMIQDSGLIERVRSEVCIHFQLQHSSVVQMYQCFVDTKYIYMVLDLCRNGEVHRYLKKSGRKLSECEVCRIFRQVVEGVLFLHSHNILHRDLSLSNILLTDGLDAKISDFGLATLLHMPEEKHYTFCGTPNYIPPEVASREPHGLEFDVWSLGIILYTLFTGKPPFDKDGEGVNHTLERIVKADYSMPTNISCQAQNLIFSLLQKEPKHRPKLEEIRNHPFLRTSAHIPSLDITRNLQKSVTSLDSGNGTISSSQFSSQFQRGPMKATVVPKAFQSAPSPPPSSSSLSNLPIQGTVSGHAFPLSHSAPSSRSTRHRRHRSSSAAAHTCISEEAASGSLVSTHTASDTRLHRSNSYDMSSQYLGTDSNTASLIKLQAKSSTSVGSQSKPPSCGRKQNSGRKALSDSGPTVISQLFCSNVEKGRSGGVESFNKMTSLVVRTPPLNAIRLAPLKHEYEGYSLIVTPNNEVCLEIQPSVARSKKSRSVERAKPLKEIVLISSNGMDITVYKPVSRLARRTKQDSSSTDGLSVLQQRAAERFPGMASVAQYSYHSLPSHYWDLYKHAADIVLANRAKTPKLVVFTDFGKCTLMENGPIAADLKVSFYTGAVVHLSKNLLKVTLPGSAVIEHPASYDVSTLSPDVQLLAQKAREGMAQCLKYEEALKTVEHSSSFPARIGSRPKAGAANQTAGLASTTNNSSSVMSPSTYGGSSQEKSALRNTSAGSTLHSVDSSADSRVEKQCVVSGVGTVQQFANGSILVHYKNGDRMHHRMNNMGVIEIAHKDGQWINYSKESAPPDVRSKLQLLPELVTMLSKIPPLLRT